MRLPAADDLFRPTVVAGGPPAADAHDPPSDAGTSAAERPPSEPPAAQRPAPEQQATRRPSGRVRHDEKMTVYVTADELLDLEHARLVLRRRHGLGVDRGRLVREAVAIALADLEANGDDSDLVRRLSER